MESNAEEWEVPNSELSKLTKIGEGSFGTVNSASWRGTPVAVKVLPMNQVLDVSKFKTLIKLHHPNVLQLLGACTLAKPYKIITELMQGSIEKMN